jgi:hypothetical protein
MKRVTKPKAEAMGVAAREAHIKRSANPFKGDYDLESACAAWYAGWDKKYNDEPMASMDYDADTGMWTYLG